MRLERELVARLWRAEYVIQRHLRLIKSYERISTGEWHGPMYILAPSGYSVDYETST